MVLSFVILTHGFQWKWPNFGSWLLIENVIPKHDIHMPSNYRLWKNVKTQINQHLFACIANLMFMTKKFSKINFFFHISKCRGEWCPQMKTLASMYKIGGWKLPSLQNCLKYVNYIPSYPHTLILKQGKTFLELQSTLLVSCTWQ
jgi:hypothetical protein